MKKYLSIIIKSLLILFVVLAVFFMTYYLGQNNKKVIYKKSLQEQRNQIVRKYDIVLEMLEGDSDIVEIIFQNNILKAHIKSYEDDMQGSVGEKKEINEKFVSKAKELSNQISAVITSQSTEEIEQSIESLNMLQLELNQILKEFDEN